MTAGPGGARASEAFFGRRRGKAIRPGQAEALLANLPRYRIDLKQPAPAGLPSLFAAPVRSVRLEIGFGGGEHLLAGARAEPDCGFIGVEPFVNGMARVMAVVGEAPLDNLRVYDDDATAFLDWLPPASVERVDLLYPDPWPKRKHWKRRFVSHRNLDRIARVLARGGQFRFASDIDSYVNWTLLHCRAHPLFEWIAADSADWEQPFEGWPGTRYEAKALREGRRPAYLRFRRR
jgi:tRNA (guanine-N7-)-methyltransferase